MIRIEFNNNLFVVVVPQHNATQPLTSEPPLPPSIIPPPLGFSYPVVPPFQMVAPQFNYFAAETTATSPPSTDQTRTSQRHEQSTETTQTTTTHPPQPQPQSSQQSPSHPQLQPPPTAQLPYSQGYTYRPSPEMAYAPPPSTASFNINGAPYAAYSMPPILNQQMPLQGGYIGYAPPPNTVSPTQTQHSSPYTYGSRNAYQRMLYPWNLGAAPQTAPPPYTTHPTGNLHTHTLNAFPSFYSLSPLLDIL